MSSPCLHDIFEDGPRVPCGDGWATTDECVMCGAWRTTHLGIGRWRPAYTLQEVSDSDGNPQGGDGTAPSRSDDSAGRNGIAHTQEPSHD